MACNIVARSTASSSIRDGQDDGVGFIFFADGTIPIGDEEEMSPNDFPEHHCLLIVAQNQWKEMFRDISDSPGSRRIPPKRAESMQ